MDIRSYVEEAPARMKRMLAEIPEGFLRLGKTVEEEGVSRIVLTGSGTSYHSAAGTRAFLQDVCGIRADALYPFMVTENTFQNGEKTLAVGISQGGGSRSTYNALKRAKAAGCYIATMTAAGNSLVDSLSDFVLRVPCGEEKVGAKTKGYHCTLLNIFLMGLSIAGAKGKMSGREYGGYVERIGKTIDNMQNIIEASTRWIRHNMDELAAARDIRVVGTHDIYGTVLEGALKLLETVRCPVSGYEFEEFIHGIYNAINADSYVLILDSGEDRERVGRLESILAEWTEHVFVIGPDIPENTRNLKLQTVGDPYFRVFEYPVPLQLMCHYIPEKKGINPGIPKDPRFHQRMDSKAF